MVTVASQNAATFESCVTTTTAAPVCRAARMRMFMISWLVVWSSAPVGSSAKTTARLHGERTCDGDALHLAAAHFAGTLLRELAQSQSFQP